MKIKPRIGVVNWDAIYPSDTYFGKYAIRSLGNSEHSGRLPYFAKKDEKGNYYFVKRTQEDYDKELVIAADAGIDFFMYCWYPEGKEPRTIGIEQNDFLAEPLAELNQARKLYQSSAVNRRIKMCAIIITAHAYSEKDFEALTDAMREEYYEKKDGRPLVFFFGGYKPKFFSALREIAKKKGLSPYVIFMNNGAESENGDYSEADAVSAYASGIENVDTYEEFFLKMQAENENRKKYGVPILPMFSAGWNPQPRIDRPVPWCSYNKVHYAPAPTADQIEKAAIEFFEWMKKNEAYVDMDYFVSFAWNEFEEGGYLCPTLGADGKPKSDALMGLSRALKRRG